MFTITVVFHLPYQHTYQMPLTSTSPFPSSKPISYPGLFAFIHFPILVMTHSFTNLFVPWIFDEKLQYTRNCFSPGTIIENKTGLISATMELISWLNGIKDLVQRSADYVLWAKPGPPPIFVNIVLLGYSHTHSLVDSVAAFSNGQVELLQKCLYGP